MDRKFPYTCVFPRVILEVWVPDLDQIRGIEIRIRDVNSQALAASWRKCRWRQLHLVGRGSARRGGTCAPSHASEASWRSCRWRQPHVVGGGARGCGFGTPSPGWRRDGHDPREIEHRIVSEAERWPRSSRNGARNGLRGGSLATILEKLHTEWPPRQRDVHDLWVMPHGVAPKPPGCFGRGPRAPGAREPAGK